MDKNLNKTEESIVELLQQELEIREIAEKLNISSHTVKSYVNKLEKINKI